MTYKSSIYIFHRSLRLDDNLGLIEALKQSDIVIPIFIFTPEQIGKNKYKSEKAVVFMINALLDLNSYLKKKRSKLFIFYEKQHKIVLSLLKNDNNIEAVYINKEYTKYGIKREKKIKNVCNKYDIILHSVSDYLLHDTKTAVTGTGGFYSKFTPFYNNIIKNTVDSPIINTYKNYITSKYKPKKEIDIKTIQKLYNNNVTDDFPATRKEALKRVLNIKEHKNYGKDRNVLTSETTRLSPYIKFGLVSIREVYDRIKKLYGKKHDLIKQLYWREFYYILAYNRPDVFDGKSFKPLYDNINWKNDKTLFTKWKQGKTGFPIVDAGMRELNETGYMHNRSRLITSNFMIKLLGTDWKEGERYYATKLVDYDPSVNNGNWQWSAGSGADSQPYFRIFNPWTQGVKFDPECIYIKKWIPELSKVINKDIHNWDKEHKKYNIPYPKPCIIYSKERVDIIKRYKKIY